VDAPFIERFYQYANRRGGNKYVGYHNESGSDYVDLDPDLDPESILMRGLDNLRPLYIHHGQDGMWQNYHLPPSKRGLLLEISFRLTPDQIYVCDNRAEYVDLTEINTFDGRYHHRYSNECEHLIDLGKRWFLLVNDTNGENESFLALSNNFVEDLNVAPRTFRNDFHVPEYLKPIVMRRRRRQPQEA
jgi:hypothetical protein